jgi:hypothetical protein
MDEVLEKICEISSQVRNDNTPEDQEKKTKLNELSNKLNFYLQEIIGPMNGVNITINSHYDKSRPNKNYFEILNEKGELIKKITARNPFNDEEETFNDEITIEQEFEQKFTENLIPLDKVPERNKLEYKEIMNKLKETKLYKKITKTKFGKNILNDAYITHSISKKGYNIYDDITYTRQFEFYFKDNNSKDWAFRFQYIYLPEYRHYISTILTVGKWDDGRCFNLLKSRIEFDEIKEYGNFNNDEMKMLIFLLNVFLKVYDSRNIYAEIPNENEN